MFAGARWQKQMRHSLTHLIEAKAVSKRSILSQPVQPEVFEVKRLSGIGVDHVEWLHGAERAVGFLQDNARAKRVIIYALAPHVLIHGVLAPLKNLNPPDQRIAATSRRRTAAG